MDVYTQRIAITDAVTTGQIKFPTHIMVRW
jgi:hypothetical protein